MDSDFEGFMGFVGSEDSFPLLSQEGFEIIPGHNNLISLSASKIDAAADLQNLNIADRRCRFEEESENMTIHNSYSYNNCMFECGLLNTKEYFYCTPWYFPSSEDNITLCDPWQSIDFLKYMVTNITDELCSYCVPDCSTTIYQPTVMAVPFRPCDSSNLGVSRLCNLNSKDLPQPTKYGTQVLNEYQARNKTEPYLAGIRSSLRRYASTLPDGDVFKDNLYYNAYDKDIAMVQIFFQKSTVFQMGSQPRMTWIDYLSTVGGLLGLVLGMGFVSFIELFWLCLRLAAHQWKCTHLIP